ncbi:MAG: hypothetical protein ABWZ66_05895 [Pyrinomonadaceae bacterium]
MINQLIKPVFFLTAIALPLWIAVRIWLNASRKKRNEPVSIKRELTLTVFFIYIIFVAAVTLMPFPMTSFKNSDAANTNFIPLINSDEIKDGDIRTIRAKTQTLKYFAPLVNADFLAKRYFRSPSAGGETEEMRVIQEAYRELTGEDVKTKSQLFD